MDASLQSCLRILLRPVARFCVKRGLTVRELLEEAKYALLEAAEDDIRRRGEKVNISRLSIVTGLQRRDVMRLQESSPESPRALSLPGKVLSQWENSPEWHTPKGRPRVLTCGAVQTEFSELVQSVSRDLNPATVLFELERTGAVERTAGGVRLKRGYMDQRKDLESALQLAATDAVEIIDVVEENVDRGDETPNLHARTEFDNIYESSSAEIREWLLTAGTEFHTKVREYLARHDADFNPGLAGMRVILGTFGRLVSGQRSDSNE